MKINIIMFRLLLFIYNIIDWVDVTSQRVDSLSTKMRCLNIKLEPKSNIFETKSISTLIWNKAKNQMIHELV